MFSSLAQLGRRLRASGVPCSPPEVGDAIRAAAAVGLEDRERLRIALRGTLVKRAADRALFDRLFDAVFAGVGDSAGAAHAELVRLLGVERAGELADVLRGAELSPIVAAAAGAAPASAESLAATTGADAALDSLRSPLQIGFASYRLAAALGYAGADAEIDALGARLVSEGRFDADEAERVADLIRRRLAELQESLRAYVERRLIAQVPDHREALTRAALAERPLAALSAAEVAELSAEVDRLARRLIARVRRRRADRRRGGINVARTLRMSLATSGVPFEIARRRRRPRRPHVVILCDVSDSVRNVSRFMLQFVYTLQDLFDRVRSFAFVAELGELTRLFASHPIERAVELAGAGEVVNVFANSNYGRALERFRNQHIGAVSRRSTVIVIGDGRNNYHDPGLEHLAAIRRRAGRLFWINPEPVSAWGFGDSAMREYAPLCDQVAVAGNLKSLRRVIDELVGR